MKNKLVTLLTIIIFFGVFTIYGMNNNPIPVSLSWNIAKGESIAYEITKTTFNLPNNIKLNSEKLSTTLPNIMVNTPSRSTLIALMKKLPDNNIDVNIMTADTSSINVGISGLSKKKQQKLNEKIQKKMRKYEGKIELTEEINSSGGLISSNISQQEKNLLVQFFQLPKSPVKVGDSWPLNINLITLDPMYFTPSIINNINKVHFVSLTKLKNGDEIATLNYDILQQRSGTMAITNPTTQQVDSAPLSISMSFVGQGLFSITKGRWLSFTGKITTKNSGLLSANQESTITLTQIKNISGSR